MTQEQQALIQAFNQRSIFDGFEYAQEGLYFDPRTIKAKIIPGYCIKPMNAHISLGSCAQVDDDSMSLVSDTDESSDMSDSEEEESTILPKINFRLVLGDWS